MVLMSSMRVVIWRSAAPALLTRSTRRRPGVVDEAAPRLHLPRTVRDQILDLLGGIGAALRQRPHLLRHHRETAARLTCTRRLDARVERQKIGLEGDLVDDADDL